MDAGAVVAISSITLFELWYGVAKSAQYEKNVARLAAFLVGPLRVLSFDGDDARIAGNIRGALEAKGRPIAAYDVLIAAQAIRTESTLVTANTGEFGRVAGLVWEDWVSGASSARP